MSETVTKAKRAPKRAADKKPMAEVKMNEVILHRGDEEIRVMMREHIPAVERTLLMGKIESLYFIGGEYDPAYGDLSVLFILSRMYTDQDFDDDMDRFELFAKETGLQDHLPAEAIELFGYVQEKVDFLVKKRAVSDEAAEMYRSVGEAARGIATTMNAVTACLDMAAKSFEGENKASFDEIASVLKVLGRQDEKKITEAIIEYQAEKAKARKAERQPAIVKKVEKA